MVHLVGAGPGEPGYLTVRGRDLLSRADLAVVDAGLPPAILKNIPRGAIVIEVRGAGGAAVARRRLITAARRGAHAVRLVGGTPSLSGPAAAEAGALARAGVRFEIVPGVSAADAASACAGMPFIAPGLADTVAFGVLAGDHDMPSPAGAARRAAATDPWEALVAAGTAVVDLAGGGPASAARRLLRAGRRPGDAAAIVAGAGHPDQQVRTGTLGAIARRRGPSGAASPALLIVGPTVRLGSGLDWRSRRPLAGRTIVVTRASDQAAAFSALLREAGARVIEAPAIALRPPRTWAPVDRALARLDSYGILIFTSVNGVRRFFERMRVRRVDLRALHGRELVAIGPATAAALEERGLRVAVVPEEFRAEGLVGALARHDLRGARILVPRAAVARDVLVRELGRRGARVEVAPVYRTVASAEGLAEVRAALRAGRIDLVTFASSSTVENFALRFAPADRRRLCRVPAAVIGPITAATARRHGFRVAVQPRDYTIPALAAAIIRRLRHAVVD
jgi:uroporphyrinogen III methyltransferase/synthase